MSRGKNSKAKSGVKLRAGAAGYHFFNRTTGLNILVDEVIPRVSMWSAAPRHVSIALTNNCDLDCPHCYVSKKESAMLNFECLLSWIIDLDKNGCIGVGFGGGEPTLYPQLAELCSCVSNKTDLAVTLTTHAHRMTDQLLHELDGNLHFVRVSMDGIGSTYEAIRNCSFDLLLKRIASISRISRFGINYLVNSKTINDLDSAVQLATDLGASQFLLLPEEPAGRSFGIDKETISILRKWVNAYRGSIPLAVSEGGKEGLPTCDPLSCESGIAAFAHIDALGTVKKTSFDSNGIDIGQDGVMAALDKLKTARGEAMK